MRLPRWLRRRRKLNTRFSDAQWAVVKRLAAESKPVTIRKRERASFTPDP